MATFKCKMCGGNLEITEGMKIVECAYCGTNQTVPNADNEKKINLFNRATRLRMAGEFDKAAMIYENIIAEFPQEAEAYWGLCLSNYGIEYVDDPLTGNKIPTCHRASYNYLQNDAAFKMAINNSDMVTKELYYQEAREIDRIMEEYRNISKTEKPYDVFICYKETDEYKQRTIDSVIAQDIYDALTAKGLNVFFARISLEDKIGKHYEPYIFAALNSAKIMLVISTKSEYYDAVWVKNEWSRFLKLTAVDKSKTLIPCYKDLDAYDLPDEFRMLQAQDLGKVGAIQDLLRGIDKILGVKTVVEPEAPPVPKTEREKRANGPLIIQNISAIGSCDSDNPWPKGRYQSVFNIDQFEVVHFHISVQKHMLSHLKEIKTSMIVKNSKGDIVFEDVGTIGWQSNYDRFSQGWIIRGSDGTTVMCGKYVAEFWVENSRVRECEFEVTSNQILWQARRDKNLCTYCGGIFRKNMFGTYKCSICGRKKDY